MNTRRICGLTAAMLGAFVALAASSATADECLQEAYGTGKLNCTAEDIAIASIEVTNVIEPCSEPGDTFTFDGILHIESNATNRYDLGFYVGENALTAMDDSCTVVVIPPDQVTSSQDGDQCGDVSSAPDIGVSVSGVTAVCADTDSDGFFDVSTCSTWRNTSSATDCSGPSEALPGTPSKCNCTSVNTTLELPVCTTNAECAADENACTDSVCNPSAPGADGFGCTVVNNTAPCSDGLFCNGVDACAGGSCTHPGDPCTGGAECGNVCNESSDDCFVTGGTACRSAAGACDLAESCTGTSSACPADALSTATCRAAGGACDAAEVCDGSSASCPADTFTASGTTCRASGGVCDAAEVCDGSSTSCPADTGSANGTACTTDNNPCTNDVCTDNACTHPNNTVPCDDGLFCTMSDTCTGGACNGLPMNCSDNQDCSVDSCNEDTNACESIACEPEAPGDEMICRSPGYWSTHGGFESKSGKTTINVTQELLDAVGPIEVCGQTLTSTSNSGSPYLDGLGLSSTLEALCSRTQGVKERQLYRQLVAAALNCAVSGMVNDCDLALDDLVEVTFTECSNLCEGSGALDGPTVGECIEALDTFNNGGQVIDGTSSFGTCESQPEIRCGGDSGTCPDFNALPQACVPFETSCHSDALCNEEIGFCPLKTPASSSGACYEAKFNDCTIDSCN